MLKIKFSVKKLFIGIVILILLVSFFTFVFPLIPAIQAIHGRKVLLQKTDFQELLKAGRELINKAKWEEYVKMEDGKKGRILIIPKDVKKPKIIRMLRRKLFVLPVIIHIFNNRCLEIEFCNRLTGDFGVLIFPEDFNESKNKYIYPDDIMLLPGMW